MKQKMLFNLKTATAVLGLAGGAIGASAVQAGDTMTAPELLDNNDPIALTGRITSKGHETFELKYDGQNTITVEMDDWDRFDEATFANVGEQVTVYGLIDHDLFETRKIEAGSLYSHDRSAYFTANSTDEEDFFGYYSFAPTRIDLETVKDDAWIGVRGYVEEVDGDEFTLRLGSGSITVDTDDMSYNPLDDEGLMRVKAGDMVYVSGSMDRDFFEDKEIDARRIVTLYKS